MIRKWVLTTANDFTRPPQRLSYTRRCFTEWGARVAAAGMNRTAPYLNWIVVHDPEGRYAISTSQSVKAYDREKYGDVPRRPRDVKVYRRTS